MTVNFNATSNALELVERLSLWGGAIVASADCSPEEIVRAREQGRLLVTHDGLGFVHRTHRWLANRDEHARDLPAVGVDWLKEG